MLRTTELFGSAIERYLHRTDHEGQPVARSARARTLLPLLRTAVFIVLVTIVTLIVLSELGVEPRYAFVIEDASAGVQAAKSGGMAAIGVARADDAALLTAAHADLVVTTLDDVDTTALAEGKLAARKV